ncbi:hypothetical protein DESUT3_38930 [Desulfuromonas versatilis]|uniref:Blue (type 1) copper domain-containing protein n=1 Tax=Desulfuromonas versatilis TaxID=2802975 RepID=A0ABM8HV83_9BACT|nr:plastocyanin/azurin family copper-binding protein [Desulfuromonas versatilis]BCR06824.1 hypothetical protein DESUT3_38930 [Desulfuromonas versatilis]
MLSRRALLQAGGLWLAGLWLAGLALGRPGWSAAPPEVVEIHMRSDPSGAHVAFDPVGLLIRPGQRVRWVNDGHNVHTATAYHPDNARHPLRIPAGATPWDSGYLLHPGDSFELQLTVEGIYDYYCAPHEAAGMVGRIVVLSPGRHPSALPEPYPDDAGNPAWEKVPPAALANFPAVETILRDGGMRN